MPILFQFLALFSCGISLAEPAPLLESPGTGEQVP